MNRRDFLKGAAAVTATAVLPIIPTDTVPAMMYSMESVISKKLYYNNDEYISYPLPINGYIPNKIIKGEWHYIQINNTRM